ncbi:hypothetical protein ACIBF1_18575 [Spirillospora sp. NPDC050679]
MNGTHHAIAHLDALAASLTNSPLQTERDDEREVPLLHVHNPQLLDQQGNPILTGTILVSHDHHARPVFRWSDGDVLGPVDDLDRARDKVLAAFTVGEEVA